MARPENPPPPPPPHVLDSGGGAFRPKKGLHLDSRVIEARRRQQTIRIGATTDACINLLQRECVESVVRENDLTDAMNRGVSPGISKIGGEGAEGCCQHHALPFSARMNCMLEKIPGIARGANLGSGPSSCSRTRLGLKLIREATGILGPKKGWPNRNWYGVSPKALAMFREKTKHRMSTGHQTSVSPA